MSDILVSKAPQTNILNISEYPHIKDSELFRVLRQLPKMSPQGPWVAGGAVWRTINNEPLDKCDIDIFFQSEKQFEESVLKMASLPFVNNVVKEIKNRWNTIYKCHVHEKKTFDKTYDVQFINMNFHPNIESLFESFDFTVCQFGYDGENLHCGLSSLEDLAAKRIRIYNSNKLKALFKHLHKYLSNGFTISSDQTRDLSYRIMGMNCFKKSDSPDYDDDENKKECDEKYISPISPIAQGQDDWGNYGYTANFASTSAYTTAAPIVEQEDEEIGPVSRGRRVGRGSPRAEREGNVVRRNRRVAVDADPLQANTGWVQAGAAQYRGEGRVQWGPIANAQPAAPANQPQAVVQEIEHRIQEIGRQDLFRNPNAVNAYQPVPPAAPVVQEARPVVELRPEPGAFIMPIVEEEMNQPVINFRQQVPAEVNQPVINFRQQAQQNARQALNDAFFRAGIPLANPNAEQEIANNAAQRAEDIEALW